VLTDDDTGRIKATVWTSLCFDYYHRVRVNDLVVIEGFKIRTYCIVCTDVCICCVYGCMYVQCNVSDILYMYVLCSFRMYSMYVCVYVCMYGNVCVCSHASANDTEISINPKNPEGVITRIARMYMYVCMYTYVYVCMYSMYVSFMSVCVCILLSIERMYVLFQNMYECIVCMYVCMCVCMHFVVLFFFFFFSSLDTTASCFADADIPIRSWTLLNIKQLAATADAVVGCISLIFAVYACI